MTNDPSEFAASLKGPVAVLGGGFMISRYAKAAATELGLAGIWSSYFAGRCGVLGSATPDVVTAALAFYPPDVVRAGWAEAMEVTSPEKAGARYTQACHEWGQARLAGFEGAERLAELAEHVAKAADVAGMSLFAAWRAQPSTAEPTGRATQAVHVLREHRGAAHAIAVVASGLTPLQAILAGPGGVANAEFFGWTGPFEDVSGLAERRARAEQVTDDIVAPAYAALSAAEQQELADLLGGAMAVAFPPR
jgi:hypothetical protein